MAREVTHTARHPLKLTAEDIDDGKGDVAVCLCGLSEDHPFCDGSHRAARDEEEGVRYKYVDGERREISRIEFASRDEEGGVPNERRGGEGAE